MTDPGDDLEGIGLELLTTAPAMAVPPARELARDLLRRDGDAGREPFEHADEPLAVRFTRREQPQHRSPS